MQYTITKIGRTVTLDDKLVDKYTQYDELREHPFSIRIKSQFGHKPTIEEISDEELSKLCNEILLDELKALTLLPKAITVIEEKYKDIKDKTNTDTPFEYPLR